MRSLLAALLLPVVYYTGRLGFQFFTGEIYVNPADHGMMSYFYGCIFFAIALSALRSIFALLDAD